MTEPMELDDRKGLDPVRAGAEWAGGEKRPPRGLGT